MANDIITIDDNVYAVNIISFTETSEFVDKYANRTEDWELRRELAGIYFHYEIALGDAQDTDTMEALYEKLHEFAEYHTVTLPHNSGTQTFQAYLTGASRGLKRRMDGANHWGGFIIGFIAKAPQITE